MANSVYPDETALHEPSHLDLLCLYRYLFLSAGLGEFTVSLPLPPPSTPPPPDTRTQTTLLSRCQPNLMHAFKMSLACAALLFFSGPNTWGVRAVKVYFATVLLIPLLSFFWCLRNAVFRDSGISWRSSLIMLCICVGSFPYIIFLVSKMRIVPNILIIQAHLRAISV